MSHLLSLSTIGTSVNNISSAAGAASRVLSIGSPFPKPSSSSSAYRLAFESKAMSEEESQKSVMKREAEEKAPEKLPPPPPPEKPLPGDCCGNGCVPCVWDIYYEELQDYNKLLAENKSSWDPGKVWNDSFFIMQILWTDRICPLISLCVKNAWTIYSFLLNFSLLLKSSSEKLPATERSRNGF